MGEKTRRNWIIALPLMVAIVAAGVWIWSQDETTASTVDTDVQSGEVALVTDTDRTPIPLDYDGIIPMTVYQSPTCGCCGLWVEHVEAYGFEVETHLTADMGAVKEGLSVPFEISSCHTAVVEGYVIEGHVPGEDIRRLLAETPTARGLTVPGMPIGSPGMEMDDRIDPYDVLLFTEDGEIRVWASHGPNGTR